MHPNAFAKDTKLVSFPVPDPHLSSELQEVIRDADRLEALYAYDAIDKPSSAAFDDLTRLAAHICQTSAATITLVDGNRQHFVSCFGVEKAEAPIEKGLCPIVVLHSRPLVVTDTSKDDRFKYHPFVIEEGVVFYAGIPLVTPDGYVIGSLCVFDYVARDITKVQVGNLKALARQVMSQLELKLAAREITRTAQTLAAVSYGVAAEVGDAFFPALVKRFTEALEVDYAYVALISDKDSKQLKTLAVCYKNEIVDNFEYDIAGTPCEHVLQQHSICWHEHDIQKRYPESTLLERLKIESYAAIPILDLEGDPSGVLVVMHTQPFAESQQAEALLSIFSVRIAAELARQKDRERQQVLLAKEQAARALAEAASRMKDEFLAVVSHELRSPLNPILGWSKLLRRGSLTPDRVDAALETIERNAVLQARLVDDLLDVSQILRGRLSLKRSTVKLSKAIAAALETIQLEAERKTVEVQSITSLPHGAADEKVIGDEVRLQQIFGNLLSNAVKFTPEGGKVTVTLTAEDGFALVQVSDTGRGISSAFLPSVFERFRQEDYSTTRHFGGLGLGLAIVQQLVRLHGGTVSASSEGEGKGATFTVKIPLANRKYK